MEYLGIFELAPRIGKRQIFTQKSNNHLQDLKIYISSKQNDYLVVKESKMHKKDAAYFKDIELLNEIYKLENYYVMYNVFVTAWYYHATTS